MISCLLTSPTLVTIGIFVFVLIIGGIGSMFSYISVVEENTRKLKSRLQKLEEQSNKSKESLHIEQLLQSLQNKQKIPNEPQNEILNLLQEIKNDLKKN